MNILFIIYFIYLFIRWKKDQRSFIKIWIFIASFFILDSLMSNSSYTYYYDLYLNGVIFNLFFWDFLILCLINPLFFLLSYKKRYSNVNYNLSIINLKANGTIRNHPALGPNLSYLKISNIQEELPTYETRNNYDWGALFFIHLSWINTVFLIHTIFIYLTNFFLKPEEGIILNWRQLEKDPHLSQEQIINILQFVDRNRDTLNDVAFTQEAINSIYKS